MAKIYRIEDSEGSGIYTSRHRSDDLREMLYGYQDAPQHPTPWQDPKMSQPWHNRSLGLNDEMVFGFSSKAQLTRWFNNKRHRKVMGDDGFRVSIYEVDSEHVIRGLVQVAFNRLHAKRIGSVDAETLGRN